MRCVALTMHEAGKVLPGLYNFKCISVGHEDPCTYIDLEYGTYQGFIQHSSCDFWTSYFHLHHSGALFQCSAHTEN